jgi:flagellin-like protein
MKKGITPIVSTIILLLITIALAGAAWTYMQGYLFSQISKSFTIPTGGAFCEAGRIKIYALNTGYQSSLTSPTDFIMAEVDGVSAVSGLQTITINQGQAALVFQWCCGTCGSTTCGSGYHQVRLGTTSTITDPRVNCP